MKPESQSPSKTRSDSRKTDAVREFFTAMLATVALSAAGFGLLGKMGGSAESVLFSMRESSQHTQHAKSTFREFAQEVIPEEPVAPVSAYDAFLAELDAGNTPSPELYVAAAKELLSRGAGSDAKTIIQSGVIAHPDAPVIALGSIDVRAATGEADAAWTELAQTGDTSNPEVMSRLIKYATAAGKVDETRAILDDLSLLLWVPSTQDWSNLVNMLTGAGRIEDAKAASQYSPEAAQLEGKLEAISNLNESNFQEAEDRLKAYIASIADPTSEDWALLAEAHAGQGETLDATNAYREAEGLKIEELSGTTEGGGSIWNFLAGMFGGG